MFESLYLQYLFGGVISLIVITNPLSKIPLFISLTQGMSEPRRAQQAKMACIYAAAVMAVSLLAGNLILAFFGISYGALRIAGGFVVAVIGYQMMFMEKDASGHADLRRSKEDYSFFPIAMPGISGPGTIAVVIGLSTEIAELPMPSQVVALLMTGLAIVITCVGIWLVLKSADVIASKLGRSGNAVLSKLMGFLLICIGVQFMGSGVRTFMAGS